MQTRQRRFGENGETEVVAAISTVQPVNFATAKEDRIGVEGGAKLG